MVQVVPVMVALPADVEVLAYNGVRRASYKCWRFFEIVRICFSGWKWMGFCIYSYYLKGP